MTASRTARHLAAILAADVVGYSRLMGADEEGTLAVLKAHRAAVLEPQVAAHGGRVVKLMGDGLLAEFPSVTEAVRCAIAVQEAPPPPAAGEHILLRIGVHMGDVIAEGDDIYGDGVNVAARLEAEAPTGGIVLSGTARDGLGPPFRDGFRDLGERHLKNIAGPVRLWEWTGAARATAQPPVRPSIAVLPFDNMSGDPEQAYLADGIAEDILTGLARVRWLVVCSRNSSFAYRGKHTDLRLVARDLGVRYVLEGSVRRAGQRVRVTAQLIDAAEDRHLWAERYDRELADIFDLQDAITAVILGAIEPELGLAEQDRARRKPPDSLDAWDHYLRGQYRLIRFTAADNAEAQRCYRQAIVLDPDFAPSHAGLAYACHLSVIEGFAADPAASLAEGLSAARRAIALDEKDAMAHSVLARILTMNREHEAAVLAGRTAVALNPNIAQVRFGCALALALSGAPGEAEAQLDAATRLSPHDPNTWSFMIVRAWSAALLGRFEEAADWARRAAAQPNAVLWHDVTLAAALGHLGRLDEARTALARFRAEYPDRDPEAVWQILPFRDPAQAEPILAGIRKVLAADQPS